MHPVAAKTFVKCIVPKYRSSLEISVENGPGIKIQGIDIGVRKAGETDYVCFPKNESAID
jgi:hypothetical protein